MIKKLELEKKQMLWFVKKVLLLSENTVDLPHERGKFIRFPVDLLKEESDLFLLGRYESECGILSESEEYRGHCEEMLDQIKKDIPFLRNESFFLDKKDFNWFVDEDYYFNEYSIIINSNFKELFLNYLSFINNNKKIKSLRKNVTKTSNLVFTCKNKKVFQFNDKTGDFILGKKKGNLNPRSNEFNFLIKLLSSDDYQSDYNSLIKSVWSNRNDSSSNKMDLSTNVIKSIKIKFGILPKKPRRNPDIIRNVKKHGYRLDIQQKP